LLKSEKRKHTEINIYYEQRIKAATYVQQVQENDFLELLENKNGRGSFSPFLYERVVESFDAQFLQPFDHLCHR